MRKIFVTMMLAAAVSVFAGVKVSQSALPKGSVEFIAKYFPDEQIKEIEKEAGRRGDVYEVEFLSGAEVEFTSDGNWKEVKASKGNAVPAGIVPAGIVKYVDDNFKGQSIVEISRKRGGYEVELSNDSKLMLTEKGTVMPSRGDRGMPIPRKGQR